VPAFLLAKRWFLLVALGFTLMFAYIVVNITAVIVALHFLISGIISDTTKQNAKYHQALCHPLTKQTPGAIVTNGASQ